MDLHLSPGAYRYTRTAMLLHWLSALAIVVSFVVGLQMVDMKMSVFRLKLYNWHKWAGVTLLALSVARLLWRWTHRPPALPTAIEQAMPAWQRLAHHATHHGLYVLFFAVPLLGWAYSSAAGFPIVWLGQIALPDFVGKDPALADLIKPLHELAAWALVGLAALHIGAALKHHWIDRDGLLTRMLPGRH